jgi:hypothetical protein
METQSPASFPSADDAQRLLDTAVAEERATRNPDLPWAFFMIQATSLAVICAAQMLPPSTARGVTLIGIVVIVAVGVRFVFYRPRYGVVLPDGAGAFPYTVAMIVTVGVPAGFAIALDQPWLWLIAAVCAAARTLNMGHQYRKATHRV